jgi:hypothetical protein
VAHVIEMDRHVTLAQQLEGAGDGPVILINKFDVPPHDIEQFLTWPGLPSPSVAVGFALYLACLWLFATVGRGTPGPWDAPRRFVAVGPYRWVRNPIYLAALLVVIGEAYLFGSLPLLVYSGGSRHRVPRVRGRVRRTRVASAIRRRVRPVPAQGPTLDPASTITGRTRVALRMNRARVERENNTAAAGTKLVSRWCACWSLCLMSPWPRVRRTALDTKGTPIESSDQTTSAFSEMAMYVLVRRNGTWWLAAGQNTPLRPSPPR